MLGQDWPRAGGPAEGATRYFHAFIVKLSGNTVVVNVSRKGCQETRSFVKAVSKRKRATRAGREAAGGIRAWDLSLHCSVRRQGKQAWDPYFATFSGTSSNCRAVLGGGLHVPDIFSGMPASLSMHVSFFRRESFPYIPRRADWFPCALFPCPSETLPAIACFDFCPLHVPLSSLLFACHVPLLSCHVNFLFPPPISLHFLAFPLCSPIFLAKKHGFSSVFVIRTSTKQSFSRFSAKVLGGGLARVQAGKRDAGLGSNYPS